MNAGTGESESVAGSREGVCPFCLRPGTEEGCFVLHEGREHPVCRPCWERILLLGGGTADLPAGPSAVSAGAPPL